MNRLRAGLNQVLGSAPLRRRVLLTVAVPALLAVAVVGIVHYWTFTRYFVSTRDAYVQADSTIVASRVSGYVSAVLNKRKPLTFEMARLFHRELGVSANVLLS